MTMSFRIVTIMKSAQWSEKVYENMVFANVDINRSCLVHVRVEHAVVYVH
jgi:hypothetical protein